MTTASTNKLPDFVPIGSVERADAGLSNALALFAMNRLLATATVAIGTTASKVRTTTTATWTLGGQFQTAVTSSDDLWTLAGTTVAASSWQKYLLMWDATGASGPVVVEGTQSTISAALVGWKNINNVSPYGPIISLLNTGYVIVGVLTVATDSTHTFVPGTTLLSAAGITDTYADGIDPTLLPVLSNRSGAIFGSAV